MKLCVSRSCCKPCSNGTSGENVAIFEEYDTARTSTTPQPADPDPEVVVLTNIELRGQP